MFKNAKYLFLAQGANYLFPLIALPYLTRTLGVAGFGIYAFTQVVIQYGQVITDFGFNLTATRKVAASSQDKKELTKLFWSVLAVKFVLAVIVSLVMAVVVGIFVDDGVVRHLWAYSLLGLWGTVFFPIWYFQGIESMSKIAWINIASKCAGLVILVLTVHDTSDIAYAGLAQSLPSIFAAVFACWIIYSSKMIGFFDTNFTDLKREFFDGLHIFTSSALSAVIANSGTFVLGLYHSPTVVGVYAASERLVKAVVGCFAPITQAIYPGNARAFSISLKDGFDLVGRTGRYIIVLAAVAAIALWAGAPLVRIFFNWNDVGQIEIIRALAPWLFLGILNNLLGIQTLAAMGAGQAYSKAFALASLVALGVLLLGAQQYGVNAVLLSMNLAEGVLTVLLIVAVKNKWNHQ